MATHREQRRIVRVGRVVVLLALVASFVRIESKTDLVHVPTPKIYALIRDDASVDTIVREVRNDPALLSHDHQIQGSCLTAAVKLCRPDVVEALLSCGADANGPSPEDCPLYEAVDANCLECAKILMRHGANPNKPAGSGRGQTPATLAADRGDLMMIAILERGAR